ncbi:MAG: S8 family peptidase, partial [Pyrinomonadaceae bacterium]
MPSIPLKKSRAVTLPLVTLFIGLFFVSVIILPSGSRASLQSGASNTSSASRDVSGKRARPDFVPGEALVRFKRGRALQGNIHIAVPNGGIAPLQRSETEENQEQILMRVERFEGSDLVDGLRIARFASPDTGKAIAALNNRADVIYAEPNYILRADVGSSDPRFVDGSLYGLTKIGAPDAWDSIRGSSDTVQAFYGSPRVVVGVIDQGIDTSHVDLQGNIWTNPTAGGGDIPGITGDINGYDFHNNTGTVFSGNSSENHATHVAGTIGARGDNGLGVVGVNWQVSLMSLKFLSPTGSDADAIRAFSYAKQMRELWISSGGTKGANIRVLNNSYGGSGYSQITADAISALGQAGILFVAAAGNDGTDNDVFPHYPSSYSLPNMISVTSTTQSDSQVHNFGAHSVLIGAPGTGILSTTPGNAYLTFSGTSMATPHVSGAAALLCAAYPTIGLSHLRGALAFNGDVLPSLQGKTLTGRRLNVKKSLDAIASND